MARYKYTPRGIYEIDFDIKMRGYDKDQVDGMLDDVIVDYETYAAELLKLQEENEFLKNRVSELESGRGGTESTSLQSAMADLDQTQRFNSASINQRVTEQTTKSNEKSSQHASFVSGEPSNFELLKRINRLERAVFGPESKFSGNANGV